MALAIEIIRHFTMSAYIRPPNKILSPKVTYADAKNIWKFKYANENRRKMNKNL